MGSQMPSALHASQGPPQAVPGAASWGNHWSVVVSQEKVRHS